MTTKDDTGHAPVSTPATEAGLNAGWPARAELLQLCFETDVHDGWPARTELRERYPEPDPRDDWVARAPAAESPAA